jgi:hypothetical protein
MCSWSKVLTAIPEGKKVKLETETSASTRSSSHEQAEKPFGGSGSSEGFASGHKRSDSSPPRASSYGRPLRQSISQSTSPAAYSFSNVNSPRLPEQYSPISTSPTVASLVREAPFDFHHPGAFPGPEYSAAASQPPNLQSFPSASSTPPSLANFNSQYQNTRDLPTRRPYRETSSLPPLTHEDTTLSSTTLSSSTSHSNVRPETLLPIVDPSKAQRLLPQPVPMLAPQPSHIDQRQLQGGPGPPMQAQELRSGSSPLAALLRASELARDADNSPGDKEPPS